MPERKTAPSCMICRGDQRRSQHQPAPGRSRQSGDRRRSSTPYRRRLAEGGSGCQTPFLCGRRYRAYLYLHPHRRKLSRRLHRRGCHLVLNTKSRALQDLPARTDCDPAGQNTKTAQPGNCAVFLPDHPLFYSSFFKRIISSVRRTSVKPCRKNRRSAGLSEAISSYSTRIPFSFAAAHSRSKARPP